MDIVISPQTVFFNTQAGASQTPLAPGDVLDAKVLAVLADGRVRLAVANTLIEVATQVALSPGTTVRLAVRETPQGVQLVLVDPGAARGGGAPASGQGATRSTAALAPQVQSPPLAPAAPDARAADRIVVNDVAQSNAPPAASASPARAAPGVAQDGAVIDAAVRLAAARQNGLGAVIANAEIAAGLPDLPAPLRGLAQTLLTLRLPFDVNAIGQGAKISAEDVRNALAHSGLLLEAKYAQLSTTATAADSAAGAAVANFDLKSVLLALRQVAKTWLDGAPPPQADAVSPPAGAATGADQRAGTAGQPATQATPERAAAPPPPYRGGPLFPQAAQAPSAGPAVPGELAERLLVGSDAALARLTLLQAASLDQGDVQAARADSVGPRWNFEIPLATPQGVAVAHFEIARDGRSAVAEGARSAWRVRFSLDVEPVGPVHASITLSNGRAGVTLWAERSRSAMLLRANAGLLTQALHAADLEPGEVSVREGVPPRPAAPSRVAAGRFVDRAS
ncbi:MAG: flagellar hook-length control protein FliK [Proteobacteria bacterium]|nr:flagellar hook-length control protein FliK [Pseudomonadota bacterium]